MAMNVRRCAVICVLMAALLWLCMPVSARAARSVRIEYFYFEVCATCDPEKEMLERLSELSLGEFDFIAYNTYHATAKEEFYRRCEEAGVPAQERAEPLLLVGQAWCTAQDMQEKLPAMLAQARQDTSGAGVLYARTESCPECRQTQQLLGALMQETPFALRVLDISAAGGENLDALRGAFAQSGIPEEKQKVPAVFIGGEVLIGYEQISERLPELVRAGKALEPALATARQDSLPATSGIGAAAAAGLVAGLNPCGLTTVLLFLSILLSNPKRLLEGGIGFLGGRAAVLLVIGIALHASLGSIPQTLLGSMALGIRLAGTAIFIVVAVLYLLDGIWAARGEYGKIRMQLPVRLRSWTQRAAQSLGGRRRIGIWAFLGGAVIALPEFLCTGQLYLASVLTMLRTGQGIGAALPLYGVYIVCSLIPSVVLLLALCKGGTMFGLAEKIRKGSAGIKLATAGMFMVLAALWYWQG